MKTFLTFFCVIFLACSHHSYPPDIEKVLQDAGGNRKQLEQVLEHYSQQDKDSLKLRAAEFLIRNMPGKYTETYHTPWKDVATALYRWNYLPDKKYVSNTFSFNELQKEEDIKFITAEYLINNIDLAFKVWKEQPWGKHITFDIFCEEILPYRVDHEPLENWREKVLASFEDINIYFKSHPETNAVEACCKVNQQLPRFSWVSYPVPDMNYSMLMSTPRGSCNNMNALAIFSMRALGIPVVRDFTLQWPNRNLGHSWNAVCDSCGNHISFMGAESNPKESHLASDSAKVRFIAKRLPSNKHLIP